MLAQFHYCTWSDNLFLKNPRFTYEPKISCNFIQKRMLLFFPAGVSQTCPTCSLQFHDVAVLRTHMVMAHQVNPSNNGPTEKEEAYLECRLCKRWVLHSRGHIRSHLTMAHKSISLKEYFLNHVFNTGGSKGEEPNNPDCA